MGGHHDMVAPLVGMLEAVEDLPGAAFVRKGLTGDGRKGRAKQKAQPDRPHSRIAPCRIEAGIGDARDIWVNEAG